MAQKSKKVNPNLLSNVPLAWRPYLNRKTTSNFEVVRIVYQEEDEDCNGVLKDFDSIDGAKHLQEWSLQQPHQKMIGNKLVQSYKPFVAFVRVKSCKRTLSFKHFRKNDIQYFLELPDLLFIIDSKIRKDCREIQTRGIKVFGLSSRNQLLNLPLPNIDVGDGDLCCRRLITKLKKSDDFNKALMNHFKTQVGVFFTSKFTYDNLSSLSCYTQSDLEDYYDGFELRVHKILKNWSDKTKENKKFTFKKYPVDLKKNNCDLEDMLYDDDDDDGFDYYS